MPYLQKPEKWGTGQTAPRDLPGPNQGLSSPQFPKAPSTRIGMMPPQAGRPRMARGRAGLGLGQEELKPRKRPARRATLAGQQGGFQLY